ncbi:hypothetical protein SLNHY_3157 [Streptomyces albus]|nr:hypothetical protein SLNHY_3157 [Streptomyces albus]
MRHALLQHLVPHPVRRPGVRDPIQLPRVLTCGLAAIRVRARLRGPGLDAHAVRAR